MPNAERLPQADRAVVPRKKLKGYLLNPEHELGRHKARVFGAALGIHRGDWEYLHDRLKHGILVAPVNTVRETRWAACTRRGDHPAGTVGAVVELFGTEALVEDSGRERRDDRALERALRGAPGPIIASD